MAETKTFNEELFPDEGKLVAFSHKGTQHQFALGLDTTVGFGETIDIVNQHLTLPVSFFAKKEFRIAKEGKWKFFALSFENEIWINRVQVTKSAPVTLQNGAMIVIVSKEGKIQSFLFNDHYDGEVAWKTLLLINYNRKIDLYSDEAIKAMTNKDPEKIHEHSYQHASLYYQNSHWHIDGANLKNKFYINGKEETKKHLVPYDVIQIGDTYFVYLPGKLIYNSTNSDRRNLVVRIKERSVRDRFKKKVLLKDINVTIEPGSLVLLLGGSGAGKTTLINAITGYEPANATILNGGVDVYANYNQMKYDIGVVPQQDLLRGNDTVFNTLMNAAELRMPAGVLPIEKKQRVLSLLEDFGLLKSRNSLVKNLSGGQRKRLSICCEFISDPSLFILDEPDSGLDGVIAKELISRLRKIADSGKIVMVITHTPDRVIQYFDHIIVIAKDKDRVGRLVYYGTIDEAKEFFQRDLMEDIVKVINGKNEGGEGRADELIELFEASRKEKSNG